MKKHMLKLAVVIAGCITTHAFATDGTLTFTSNVVGTACAVTPTKNVVIDDIPTGMLLTVGSVVAKKPFEIELSNCPPSTPRARVKFEGTASPSNNTDFALDDPDSLTTAKGIALTIWNDSYPGYTIGPGGESNIATLDTSSGNVNKLLFNAGYRVLDKDIQTGTANVTTQFTIIYP